MAVYVDMHTSHWCHMRSKFARTSGDGVHTCAREQYAEALGGVQIESDMKGDER